jgi:hypothetical protein
MHKRRDIPTEPDLSAEILADLKVWHAMLAVGGARVVTLHPSKVRLLTASYIEAIADMRLAALTLCEGAAEMIDNGRPDLALLLLERAAARYRDLQPPAQHSEMNPTHGDCLAEA